MQIAGSLPPWLSLVNSSSAVPCAAALFSNHPGPAPLQPHTALVPHSSHATVTAVLAQRTHAHSLLPVLTVGAGSGLSHCCAQEQADHSLRGPNHCPRTLARHHSGELVPLGYGSGVAVLGAQLCQGKGHRKLLLLQRLGRGEACSSSARISVSDRNRSGFICSG